MESQSQPEFDRENLNEDVVNMRTLWVNELVRLYLLLNSLHVASKMLQN